MLLTMRGVAFFAKACFGHSSQKQVFAKIATPRSAQATIAGIETAHMIRKGRVGMPFVLSTPTLALRFRQNNGPTPSGDYQPSRSLSMAGSSCRNDQRLPALLKQRLQELKQRI
jgi:hypothetical protein